MKNKPYHIIIYILISLLPLRASGQQKDITRTLQGLYDRIQFTVSDDEMVRLNDSIRLIVEDYSASDSVFTHKFSTLRFLGQTVSSDQRLKIIAWNMLMQNGDNRYFTYIIRKGKRAGDNTVYKLTGSHKPDMPDAGKTYSTGDWYGALYYAIGSFRKEYVVLGLDFGGMLVSRKVIDVITFDDNGEIIFGKNIFIRGDKTRFREILEYSSQSSVSLRFNTPSLIIFDHLASFTSDDGTDQSVGSGDSYDAYEYKKGIWTFKSNVDARNPRK